MDNEPLKSDALITAMEYDDLQRECRDMILANACTVIIDNETGQIVYITEEAEREFGYIHNELVNETLEMLIPDQMRQKHVQFRTGRGMIAKARQMAQGRQVSARMKDGAERLVFISLRSRYVINKKNSEKRCLTEARLIFTS